MTTKTTISFVEAPADPKKGFRINRPRSLFRNNVTFTVTGYKFGNYIVNGSPSQYSADAQAIILTTSLGVDLSLNRLLSDCKVVYDAQGNAHIVDKATFSGELMAHMLKLGRREDNPDMLVGSVEDVAKHALAFFIGKTIVCKEEMFFAKDENGKLVSDAPTVIFSIR